LDTTDFEQTPKRKRFRKSVGLPKRKILPAESSSENSEASSKENQEDFENFQLPPEFTTNGDIFILSVFLI